MASQRKKYQEFALCLSEDEGNTKTSPFFFTSNKIVEDAQSRCEVLKKDACRFCVCCKGCDCNINAEISLLLVLIVALMVFVPFWIVRSHKQLMITRKFDPLPSEEASHRNAEGDENNSGNIPLNQTESEKNEGKIQISEIAMLNDAVNKLKASQIICQKEAEALCQKIQAKQNNPQTLKGSRSLPTLQNILNDSDLKINSLWIVCRYIAGISLLVATAITLLEGAGIIRQFILLPFTIIFGIDAMAKAIILWLVALLFIWHRKGSKTGGFLIDALIALFFASSIGAWVLMFVDTGNWNNETAEDPKGSQLWWKLTSLLTLFPIITLSHSLKSKTLWYISIHAGIFAFVVNILPIFKEQQDFEESFINAVVHPSECFTLFLVFLTISAPQVAERFHMESVKGGTFEILRVYSMLSLWLSVWVSFLIFSGQGGLGVRWRFESFIACFCTAQWATITKHIQIWRFFLYSLTVVFIFQTWPVVLYVADRLKHLFEDYDSQINVHYWFGMNIPVRLSFFFAVLLGCSSSERLSWPIPEFQPFTSAWASNFLLFSLWVVSFQGNYGFDSWADLIDLGTGAYEGRKRLLPWLLPLLCVSIAFIRYGSQLKGEKASVHIFRGLVGIVVGIFTQITFHLLQVLTWGSLFFFLSLCAFVIPTAMKKLLRFILEKSKKD